MRICLVSAAYRPFPSGVGEHVHHLGLALQARGHSVQILTLRYPPAKEGRHESEQSASLEVIRMGHVLVLPGNRSHFTLSTGLRLPGQVRRFLAEGRFDVVHCHGIFPPDISYWAAIASAAPVVVTFHTYREGIPKRLPALFRALWPGLGSRVERRIAVSEACRRYSEAWFPGRYDIIPNGVDLTRFQPDAPAPESMRGGPTILFVGRLDERKGLEVLIRAMPRVGEQVTDVRLVVVGSGPLEERCRKLVAELGITDRVVFAGRVPDAELPGYYANCTVYCSPALGGEAMGIVLIEAMAAGKPVVASAIAGYDEVIRSGVDGCLVPAGDAEALAASLVELLRSEPARTRLSAAALDRVQHYAWPGVAARVESVYLECDRDRRSGGERPPR
jgi:phosphatidyl-myo-inositol alpha-mannosyltransferase